MLSPQMLRSAVMPRRLTSAGRLVSYAPKRERESDRWSPGEAIVPEVIALGLVRCAVGLGVDAGERERGEGTDCQRGEHAGDDGHRRSPRAGQGWLRTYHRRAGEAAAKTSIRRM